MIVGIFLQPSLAPGRELGFLASADAPRCCWLWCSGVLPRRPVEKGGADANHGESWLVDLEGLVCFPDWQVEHQVCNYRESQSNHVLVVGAEL